MSTDHPLCYPTQPISHLTPGPTKLTFQGLVTNISSYTINNASSSPDAAKGCMNLLVTDGTGEILVKLWYTQTIYKILLGSMVKVATTHISPSTVTTGPIRGTVGVSPPARVMTSIFPEKDSGCAVEVMPDGIGLAGRIGAIMAQTGLISLRKFGEWSDDDAGLDFKILVVVLGVGEPQTITTKSNHTFQTLELTIIDHSSLHLSSTVDITPCHLSLNVALFESASTFIRLETILLISNPKLLSLSQQRFKLTPRSQVLINPNIPETVLLRNWTKCLYPRLSPIIHPRSTIQQCHCLQKFEEITKKQALGFLPRKQYTLGLFLEEINLRQQREATRPKFRRHIATDSSFIGYISVLITQISLVKLYEAGELFSGVCVECELVVYANTPSIDHECSARNSGAVHLDVSNEIDEDRTISGSTQATQSCSSNLVQLNWNSSLLSGISDETGGLVLRHADRAARHNLQLTDKAVSGLTGLKKDDFELDHTSAAPKLCDNIPRTVHKFEDSPFDVEYRKLGRLHWIEAQVSWERVTLVIGWTSNCICHDRSNGRGNLEQSAKSMWSLRHDDSDEGSKNGNDSAKGCQKIVVLDAQS